MGWFTTLKKTLWLISIIATFTIEQWQYQREKNCIWRRVTSNYKVIHTVAKRWLHLKRLLKIQIHSRYDLVYILFLISYATYLTIQFVIKL